MRLNVYSQELITDDIGAPIQTIAELETKKSNTDIVYSAVLLFLHSSDGYIHHPPKDDDRSAIAFWLPATPSRREHLAQTFEKIAALVREAPPETGLDY